MAVWGCGCVFSEDAFKELKVSDTCINCGAKILKKSDIISLNQPAGLQEAYLRIFDEARAKEVKPVVDSKPDIEKVILGKRGADNEEVKKDDAEKKESEAYKSLFKTMYVENKDTDFMCRNVHRGLR